MILFTWKGIAETLTLLWVVFLILTTRLPGDKAPEVSPPPPAGQNTIDDVRAVRSAINAGRGELREAAAKFDSTFVKIKRETGHPFGAPGN